MREADLTTRTVAGIVDLLIVLGLARLPDIIGILAAAVYILIRDGLFASQSVGKKLIGLQVVLAEGENAAASYRESIIRNAPLLVAFLLFTIPYGGWILGIAAVSAECLIAIGDDRGMRFGDLMARTRVVRWAANTPSEGPVDAGEGPEAGQDAGPADADR